jgi:hypothetical protein
LRQEFRRYRGVVAANVIDQLTFVHVRHTFKMELTGNAKQIGSF